jgi:ribosomal protein L25 (general stress protein Ctc)
MPFHLIEQKGYYKYVTIQFDPQRVVIYTHYQKHVNIVFNTRERAKIVNKKCDKKTVLKHLQRDTTFTWQVKNNM